MPELYSQISTQRFLQRRDGFKRFEGSQPGQTSAILAGVHGNEPAGLEAFKNVAPHLEERIETGLVWLGYGNPPAIRKGARHTESGANLNRVFKPDNELTEQEKNSYEYRRAQVIKRYLRTADAMLDLHGTINSRGSRPFIICEENGLAIARYLPADIVMTGFDSVQPGGTDYYMNKIGGIGICYESGWNEDKESGKRAEEALLTFLGVQGHIQVDLIQRSMKGYKLYDMYVTQTDNYALVQPMGEFEPVTEGQLLAREHKGETVLEVRASKDGVAIFTSDNEMKKAGSETFCLAEEIPLA